MLIRSSTMDTFKHVIQIMDLGTNTPIGKALQIRGINSIKHVLQMDSDTLKKLEYKKNDKFIPVPDYQIASLRLFIEYCKYRARANNRVTDYILLTQEDLD